jgi:hypothetical protein
MPEELRGWRPDPSGAHEERYFSLDGRPTRLVRDGGRASHDGPPEYVGLGIPDPPTPARAPVLAWRTDPHGDGAGAGAWPAEGGAHEDQDSPSPTDTDGIQTSRRGLSPHSGWAATSPNGSGPVEQRAAETAAEPPLFPPVPERDVHLAESGWYPDPTDQSGHRYWDGTSWTEHTSPTIATSEQAEEAAPVPESRERRRPSSGLVNVGLALIAAALATALITTGNPGTPSVSDSGAQGTHAATSSTATTKATSTMVATGVPTTSPTTSTLSAWESKYEGSVEALATDEESIDVAYDNVEKGAGGSAPLDYSPALSAAQRLAADGAADQRLPVIPDSRAESYWTTELSDLAVAAATYIEGLTDDEDGNATDGAALMQQGTTQVNKAQSQGNELRSSLSAAKSG